MLRLLIILLLLIPATAQAAQRPLTASEKAAISSKVKSALRDPDSAKFTWGPFISDSPYMGSYCGYVNAKNGMGGYSGDQMFHVLLLSKDGDITTAAVLIGDEAVGRCERYW